MVPCITGVKWRRKKTAPWKIQSAVERSVNSWRLGRSRFLAFRETGKWPRFGSQCELRLSSGNRRSGRGRRRRLLRKRLAFHQELELGRVKHFAIQQRLGDALKRILIGVQNILR